VGFSDFVAPDFENCATCVQSDVVTCVNNIFLGGQYVWTGTAIVANSASNYLRFILPDFGVSETLLSGASAAAVLIEDKFIGTSPFGGIFISPPSGDGDRSLESAAGNSAFTVFKRAGSTRWQIGRNNAAETGGNAGSQLIIERFNDSGAAIGNPVAIDRSTGILPCKMGFALPVGSKLGAFGAVPATQPSNTGNSNPRRRKRRQRALRHEVYWRHRRHRIQGRTDCRGAENPRADRILTGRPPEAHVG
jgi:hypothetical protein